MVEFDIGDLEDWRKAGKIASDAREHGRKLIIKGAKLVDVCDSVDDFIAKQGAQPAFPSQISCDNVAAHFCPMADDDTVFENQVASLDVGVSVDGAIGDTACTVDLSGENAELVNAAEEALEVALKLCKPGTTLGEIGTAIQETIVAKGFAPIRNLGGHGLERYNIHSWKRIPNSANKDATELEDGMVIAIEPFASKGKGHVEEKGEPTIFSLVSPKPVRSPFAREVLAHIADDYATLPFTIRHISSKFGLGKTRLALRELSKTGALENYPPLVDEGLTSQAEHSVLVADKPEILTR